MTCGRSFCDGYRRRDVLKIGAAGWLGTQLSLADVLGLQARADDAGAARPDSARRDVSLIILFLQGGPSTIDMFDLKPQAPAEIRGEFRPIATNVPGIDVGEHLEGLARCADKFSLVRSFTHNNSGHGDADHYMLTGYHPSAGFSGNLKPNNQRPSYGAIIARKEGPRGSVPPYVCLPRMHNSAGSAYLGSSAAPFVVDADPSAPGFTVPDLAPPMSVQADRLNNRRALLDQVDRYRRRAELRANRHAGTLSAFQQRAFDLITSDETRAAFDLEQEPARLRDEYGRHSLGQSCLMARRLVGAGVRCVTVVHNNWDSHSNVFHVLKGTLLPALDTGLPALLRDLDDRGMLDTTLVAVMGEFGRTPRVNTQAGRDHWGPSQCLLLAGGGLKSGRVIGRTNENGEKPADEPHGPEDLAATIFHCLGIDPQLEFHTPEGRPVKIVNNGRVIGGLL